MTIDLSILYKKHLATKVELPQPIPIRNNIISLLNNTFEKFKKDHELGQTSEAVTLQDKKLDIPADKESHAYQFLILNLISHYFITGMRQKLIISLLERNSRTLKSIY